MSLHVMNSLGISRAFKKSKQSQAPSTVPQHTVDAKSHKVKHVLSIVTAGVSTARSQSVSSSSTAKPTTASLSDATTVSVSNTPLSYHRASPNTTKRLDSKASSILLRDDTDTTSIKSPWNGPRLSAFPSNSTLNSHYDPAKAPLSISQQTSESSSRDFALRKGVPAVLPRTSQDMEHARQMLFFKSSKPRTKDSKKLMKINTRNLAASSSSPIRSTDVSPDLQYNDKAASRSSISLPTQAPPTTPGRKLFSGLRRAESQQIRPTPPINTTTRDPYAKINIRRPKAGAKNWFDDVEDGLSDEEDNEEPTASPHFVSQVEQVFASTESTSNRTQDSVSAVSAVSAVSTASTISAIGAIPPRSQSSASYRAHAPSGSSRALLTEHKQPLRNISFKERAIEDGKLVRPDMLRRRPSTLATADLTVQSVLCLSSSDDEDEAEAVPDTTDRTKTTKIRESLAEEQTDREDVEISIARTIKANSGEPLVRVPHPRTDAIRTSHGIPSLITVPTRASSRNASYIIDASSETDNGEADIITSFPATPSDTASFRTSIRSSMASEAGSLASTRPMLVTKQEEKLLAAMRLKKAALRKSQRDTDRNGALQVLESGGRHSAMSHRDHAREQVSIQAKLDRRLSNRYVPSHSHQRSLSSDDKGLSSARARESGTTFETSIYSQRNSQATMRTMFSDDLDSPYSAYPRSDATVLSPTRSYRSYRGPPGRPGEAHHSSQSSGSSHRRDSHVVVLDGLDEALSRDHIPSQLFMEAPFIGWERAGLATTAH